MNRRREIREGISWVGAVDWDRRLFDSLIPLPDGTSYNAYLVEGSEKTALFDTVDPTMTETLFRNLEGVSKIDYVIVHHAEQDHSGSIPEVLRRYPDAKVVTSKKSPQLLSDMLKVSEDTMIVMEDGDTLSLGDRTLEFIYTPWVHWPETMSTYLKEEKILFSCDFFGSHIATTDLYAIDKPRVLEAAKRYYAEIMMPFRKIVAKDIEKVEEREIDMIAPSHGPIYQEPKFIIDAYKNWVSDEPRNVAVIPYVSMHGSTEQMVELLVGSLAEKGVTVHQFDLTATDLGKLAITLVDAGTIVLGTPTILAGPHPLAVNAAYAADMLRPKARFASIVGSYGWGGKTVDIITGMFHRLEAELLEPVLCRGLPDDADRKALEHLAHSIADKHREGGFAPLESLSQ
jgi:flavorubredoxin